MQSSFYDDIDKNYTRSVYNVFINSRVKSDTTKNRMFSSMDIYPTTLASLGVKIDGDRLGLGTNMYSNKKTLMEELGYKYVSNELKKRSSFYDNYIYILFLSFIYYLAKSLFFYTKLYLLFIY